MEPIIIQHSCAHGKPGDRKRPGKELSSDEAKRLVASGFAVPASKYIAPAKKIKKSKPENGGDNKPNGENQNRVLAPDGTATENKDGK